MKKSVEQYLPIVQMNKEEAANPGGCLNNVNEIQLKVRYSLGGTNYFTGKAEPRGYYLHCTPVEHRDAGSGCMMIGAALGSGIKHCVLEVARQSDKQFGIACTIAAEMAPALLEWCRREYGVVCETPVEFFPDAPKRPIPDALPTPKPRKSPEPRDVKPIRTQKLLTADVIRKLEKHPLGSQDNKGDDAVVLVKFFGGGDCTWLITEGEKQEDGDWLLYGKCTLGYEWEWGSVMLSELETLRFPPFGLGVERDMYLARGAKVGELAA